MKNIETPYDFKFAFWSYDQFPGVLGARCLPPGKNKMVDEMVYVPSYGGYFKPLIVMEEDDGVALHNKLGALRLEFQNEMSKLQKKYNEKAKKLISFI